MNKPKFSIVMISRNEAQTLPKCIESLKDFQERGGEIILCDTGSTDGTAELARNLGCKVTEVGEKFITVIDEDLAQKLNKRFVVKGEAPIVKAGNKLFDFASARNFANKLASNDMICTLDCDEAYSVFNIDKLNELIDEGFTQFNYQFVFAHDQYGKPAIQFIQSKFFDRRKMQWSGRIHEVLAGDSKLMTLGPDIIYLEHWQKPGSEHRGNYLVGLSLDCYQNPDKDRQSHYLARELMWHGHPKSAIKEFERHIGMNAWIAEQAQSMIFIGDCYGILNQPYEQVTWYSKGFQTDPNRREALIKLARFYKSNNRPLAVLAYAKAAMEIPWTDYYANDKSMYEQHPHELLYWAYGWTGNMSEARKHFRICFGYQPENPEYLRDLKFYFKDVDDVNQLVDFDTKTIINGHHKFTYRGVKCTKYAFDYLNYQMIINEVKPDLIIEIGTDIGGGTLYLADLLENGMVHTIDIKDQSDGSLKNHPRIKLFTDGWENYDLKNAEGFKKILVIEDSSHTYENTLAVMKKFAPIVSVGSYLIVEDGIVTELGIDNMFNGGPLRATREFMKDNKNFIIDRKWCDFYGHNATANPDGYLKNTNKKLSVVMPVRNKKEMTEQTIKSLRENTPTLGEIILIDDGSTENFLDIPGVRYYKNKSSGVNAAWNYGATLAEYPYIAWLNNDLLFSPNWEEPLYDYLDEETWVVSPYHTAYKIPDDFPAGKDRKNNLEGVGVGIPFLGSAFIITKENWKKIGPIDERLKIWCGDNYIYETVKHLGKKCKEVPASYVHHLINQTLNSYDGINKILNKDMEVFNIIIKEKKWI
jgi:cephalosporin hydroxylase/GT2 family glycosyltransferase